MNASLLAAIAAEFQPQTSHESFLVEQMADARSRLAQLRRVSASLLDALVENPAGSPDALCQIERLATAAERAYRNAYCDLLAARKARAQAKPDSQRHDLSEAALTVSTQTTAAPPPSRPVARDLPPVPAGLKTARPEHPPH